MPAAGGWTDRGGRQRLMPEPEDAPEAMLKLAALLRATYADPDDFAVWDAALDEDRERMVSLAIGMLIGAVEFVAQRTGQSFVDFIADYEALARRRIAGRN